MKVVPLKEYVDAVTRQYVAEVESFHRSKLPAHQAKEATARALGVSLATVYRMAKKGLTDSGGDLRGDGYVYLMRDSATGAHKIGWTRGKPEYRERTLQCEKPSITMVSHWPGSQRLEKILHERYRSLRMRGEWFNLGPGEIADLKQVVAS